MSLSTNLRAPLDAVVAFSLLFGAHRRRASEPGRFGGIRTSHVMKLVQVNRFLSPGPERQRVGWHPGVSTPSGDAFSAGGVCSTLRDLARFGMLFTPAGRSGAAPIVSNAYLHKIQKGGRPHLIKDQDWGKLSTVVKGVTVSHSTCQWDVVTADGDFYKGGYGGQGLYVSPAKDLVVAWFGTYTTEGKRNGMFPVALQLAKCELFPR